MVIEQLIPNRLMTLTLYSHQGVLSICLPSLNQVTMGCGCPIARAVNWMEPPYSARRSLGDSRKKGKVGLGSGVGGSSMILAFQLVLKLLITLI